MVEWSEGIVKGRTFFLLFACVLSMSCNGKTERNASDRDTSSAGGDTSSSNGGSSSAGGETSSSSGGSSSAGGAIGSGGSKEDLEGVDSRLSVEGECENFTNGDDGCPDGFVCREHYDTNGDPEPFCKRLCQTDEDCALVENVCRDILNDFYPPVCAEPLPECDVLASEEDCECAFTEGLWIVQGEGEDCEVLRDDATACVGPITPCGDACFIIPQRYDLGDGTAIVHPFTTGSVQGWEGLELSCELGIDRF